MSSSLRQQTTTLIRERRRIFEGLLQQGLGCLRKAQREPAQEQEQLREACDFLMEAMRYDRGAPEGFVAMAYLLWLVGDESEAQLYLEEALMLDPDCRDAWLLKRQIEPELSLPEIPAAAGSSLEQPPSPAVTVPVAKWQEKSHQPHTKEVWTSRPPRFSKVPSTAYPAGPTAPDYEQLYIQLETQIQKEVKQLSLLKPDWYQSSRERLQVQRTEQLYAGLRSKYCQFLEQIRVIEAGQQDARSLRAMLKPLEMILTRCEYHLHLSWQMIQLQEMLDGHTRWISRELSRLEQEQRLADDFSPQRFEYLLDDCDALADQLDELEQMGLESSRLVKTYENLAQKVSRFQDLRLALGGHAQ